MQWKLHPLILRKLYPDFNKALEALSQDISQNYQVKSEKNQPGGYVGLGSDGKIDISHIPSIAITDVYLASSQAEQDAISPQTGDVVIRADLEKSFIWDGVSWKELLNPPAPVQSVDGRTGNVNLEDKYMLKGTLNEISFASNGNAILDLSSGTVYSLGSFTYLQADYTLNEAFSKIEISVLPGNQYSGTVTVSQGANTITTKTFSNLTPILVDNKYVIQIQFDTNVPSGTYTIRLDIVNLTGQINIQSVNGYSTYHDDTSGYVSPLQNASWIRRFYGITAIVKVNVDSTGVHITDSVNGNIDNLVQEINSKLVAADIASKADKVPTAIPGNLAAFDTNGNLIDSNISIQTGQFNINDILVNMDNADFVLIGESNKDGFYIKVGKFVYVVIRSNINVFSNGIVNIYLTPPVGQLDTKANINDTVVSGVVNTCNESGVVSDNYSPHNIKISFNATAGGKFMHAMFMYRIK